MRVIIDTNIFYEYYGREKLIGNTSANINLSRLNRILDAPMNKVVLSSVSVVEIIVRFRKDPEKLQNLIQYILDKKIDIDSHAIYKFNLDDLNSIATCNNELLKFKIKPILKEKIFAESYNAIMLLSLLLEIYLVFYFDERESIGDEFENMNVVEKSRLKSCIFNIVLDDPKMDFYSSNVRKIRKLLKKAYASDDNSMSPSNVSKEAYNDFILFNLNKIMWCTDIIIEHYTKKNQEVDFFENFYLSLENKMLDSSINNVNKIIAKQLKRYRKQFNNDYVKEKFDDFAYMWKKNGVLSEIQAKYGLNLISNWIQTGVKAEKNDVLDFLILDCLDSSDLFLTLDNDLVRFLSELNHDSMEYINRIKT